jgi:hypothetical protein
MKYLLAISMIWSSSAHAQCKDIFGKRANCPDFEDSMVIYNNALKVYDFYDKNTSYIKIKTAEINTEQDKRDIFDKLQQAKKMFFVIRREVAKIKDDEKKINGKVSPKYKDISFNQYFQEVDEYRFYERELENQILNLEAPIPIYDIRISPYVVNEYKCVDSTNIYFGDIVNIPLYIPVVVKPFSLLTKSELVMRNDILHLKETKSIDEVEVQPPILKKFIQIQTLPIKTVVNVHKEPPLLKPFAYGQIQPLLLTRFVRVEIQPTQESRIVQEQESKVISGSAVFLYNEFGSGSIIGFFKNGRFRKIRPEEYGQFAVLKFARELLENNEKLKEWISQHYGDYCIAFN